MSKLLSIRQTAEVLAMSEVSVRRMVRDGRLEHIRIGRALRVTLTSIEKIIKHTQVGQ